MPAAFAVHAAGLFVWPEIVTLVLWVAASLARLSVSSFNWGCDVFREELETRQLLFDALKNISSNLMTLPVTLVLWTIMGFATTATICIFDEGQPQCDQSSGSWIHVMNRAFEAGIVVSFILWVERLLICMLLISYYGKQYDSEHQVFNPIPVSQEPLLLDPSPPSEAQA